MFIQSRYPILENSGHADIEQTSQVYKIKYTVYASVATYHHSPKRRFFSKLHHNSSQAWHAITSFLSNTREKKNLSQFQRLIPVALICIKKICSYIMEVQMLSLDVPSVK